MGFRVHGFGCREWGLGSGDRITLQLTLHEAASQKPAVHGVTVFATIDPVRGP